MTKKTVDELLAESRALRFNFKVEPEVANFEVVTETPLNWTYSYLQVLAPVGFTFEPIIANFYEETPVLQQNGVTIIRHGHPVGKTCWAKTLCHVYGYELPADCSQFTRDRWRKLYDEGRE